MVSGGCGIPPIASLIEYFIKNRKNFGRLYLAYGAITPDDILIKNRVSRWQKFGVEVILTVDNPTPGWRGHTGFVTELMGNKSQSSRRGSGHVWPGTNGGRHGKKLKPLGFTDRRIFVSEERKMQCGIGKCQHCATGEKYVCLDGPVFNYDEIDKNWD